MYILFEKARAQGDDSIFNYDAMGVADRESTAMEWKEANPDYRTYKYCPEVQYKPSSSNSAD